VKILASLFWEGRGFFGLILAAPPPRGCGNGMQQAEFKHMEYFSLTSYDLD